MSIEGGARDDRGDCTRAVSSDGTDDRPLIPLPCSNLIARVCKSASTRAARAPASVPVPKPCSNAAKPVLCTVTSPPRWSAPYSVARSRRCTSTCFPLFDVDPSYHQPQGEDHFHPPRKHDHVHLEVREKYCRNA